MYGFRQRVSSCLERCDQRGGHLGGQGEHFLSRVPNDDQAGKTTCFLLPGISCNVSTVTFRWPNSRNQATTIAKCKTVYSDEFN